MSEQANAATTQADAQAEAPERMPRPADHPEDKPWPVAWRDYPEDADHPARRREVPAAPFNEDWAREDFGDAFVDRMKKKQRAFRGDWWLLAMLLRCVESAKAADPEGVDRERLKAWNRGYLERRFSFSGLVAHLDHANLIGAPLDHAFLQLANLDHAKLVGASLGHAFLRGASLDQANLIGASLDHANLHAASLDHANVLGASLDNANVQGTHGLLLHSNRVDRLQIEGNAPDPWSRLRREYTGPRFFFHLLLLVAFLLPYAARVLQLSAIDAAHNVAVQMNEAEGSPGTGAMQAWLDAFHATHEPTAAWWVLLGGTRGWGVVLLGAIIAGYNVLRYVLTSRVSLLRDAEERAKVTPALEEYYGVCHPLAEAPGWQRVPGEWLKRARSYFAERRWREVGLLSPIPVVGLYRLHQVARVLFWIAVGSFLIHAGLWLWTTTVWLPAG
ncbi:MAG: pentapeptide repeat-containing protein [Phycisphaeraceae bacterium]